MGGASWSGGIQYNGNITGTVWKSVHDGQIRKYDFSYDNANRLSNAAFTQYYSGSFNTNAGVDYSAGNLSYDPNGNILSMNQSGLPTATSTSSTLIDQLTYNYIPGTNKLQSVTDAVNNPGSTLGDFKYNPGSKTGTDYTYDVNGNLVSDANKNISSIGYNYLNLPEQVSVTAKGTITYTYDAAGNKLQKQTTDNTNSTTTTTVYVGGFIYVNDALQYIPQEEGRIRVNNSNTDYLYDYYLKDHLGNTRMTITDDNYASQPVLEATSYYPFGLTMSEISVKSTGKLENKYKFNGGNELQNKEFSDGSGLELYDAVHRLYDPQVGRFGQIDKLVELSIDFTTYGFARNNPILLNDPLGLIGDSTDKKGNIWHGLDDVTVGSSKKRVASKQMNEMTYGQVTAWVDGQRKKGATVETIQNWALGNSYLSNNTLDKILDGTSPTSLAIRQSESEWWKVEGKLYGILLSIASTTAGKELLSLAVWALKSNTIGQSRISAENLKELKQLVNRLSNPDSKLTQNELNELRSLANEYGGNIRVDLDGVRGTGINPHAHVEGLGKSVENRHIWLENGVK